MANRLDAQHHQRTMDDIRAEVETAVAENWPAEEINALRRRYLEAFDLWWEAKIGITADADKMRDFVA